MGEVFKEARRASAHEYDSKELFKIDLSKTRAGLAVLFPELKNVDGVQVKGQKIEDETHFTIRPGLLRETSLAFGAGRGATGKKIEYNSGYVIKVAENPGSIPTAKLFKESAHEKTPIPIAVHASEVYKELVTGQDSQLRALEYIAGTMREAAGVRKQLITNEIAGGGEINNRAAGRILNLIGLLDQVIIITKDAEIAEGTGRVENLLLLRRDESGAQAKARPWRPNHQVVL